MSNTGWIIAGAGASVGSTGEPWVNPGNITASDGVYANADAGSKDEDTYYLKASSFGFSIPSGATIDGIAVRVRAADDIGVADITEVIVGKSDATLGNDLEGGATNLSSSFTNYDYGSSTEKWGLTWTPSDVNSSNFQVRVKCNCSMDGSSQAGNPRIDAIWVDVYYTPPASSSQVFIFG